MSNQNVNEARFARNVEWDFFCDFQTPCQNFFFKYFSPEEVEKVQHLADEEGEVSKDEFLNYAKHSDFFKSQMDKNSSDTMAGKQEAIAKAERAFRLFDKDNDGYITKEEFAKISKKLNREQVDAVFNKFDKDGDGVLSFEEFRTMLNKDKK